MKIYLLQPTNNMLMDGISQLSTGRTVTPFGIILASLHPFFEMKHIEYRRGNVRRGWLYENLLNTGRTLQLSDADILQLTQRAPEVSQKLSLKYLDR